MSHIGHPLYVILTVFVLPSFSKMGSNFAHDLPYTCELLHLDSRSRLRVSLFSRERDSNPDFVTLPRVSPQQTKGLTGFWRFAPQRKERPHILCMVSLKNTFGQNVQNDPLACRL